jgi:glycosyltransferase involved in cell wall biosynthesis
MSASMPRVTVAMSVHDAIEPAYAAMAIESILNQTFRDFDCRIVTDGPINSALLGVISGYKERDKRICVLANSTNQGLAACMNRIIELTDSAYLARMDADDISAPERLERQVEFLEARRKIDLVGTFAQEIDEQGRVLFLKRMPVEPAEIRRFMAYRNPFVHPSVVFRRRFFADARLYPTDLPGMEDTGLWIRALGEGVQGSNIPQFLYSFRIDSQFWKRRRGLKRAAKETLLRVESVRKLRLPRYMYLYAPVHFLFRLSPAPVMRIMYQHFR